MAIKWTEYGINQESSKVIRTWTSHEGLVVGGNFTTVQRVMSDIYADVSYCTVWNPTTQRAESLYLGAHFELCAEHGTSTVDAPAEILAEVARQDTEAKAQAQAAQEARWSAEAKAREEAALNAPEYGKVMVVTKGRKTPIGTVGKVFWMRDGRVGLALDDTKDARGRSANVAWVDAAYLKAA